MTMTLQRNIEVVSDLIGPYGPPSTEEILDQVSAYPESKADAMRSLGEAAIAIHTDALALSQHKQKQTEAIVEVLVPGSVVDRRIVDDADLYAMKLDGKLAGRRLPRVAGSSVLRKMVEI